MQMVKQRVHVKESGWDFIAQVRCVTLQTGFNIIVVHKSTVDPEHPFYHKRSRKDIYTFFKCFNYIWKDSRFNFFVKLTVVCLLHHKHKIQAHITTYNKESMGT